MHKVEKDVLGFDHAKLGAMLLKKWKLPEEVVAAVYYHHMPTVSSGNVIAPATIHIADMMSHALQFGSSGEEFVPTLNEKAWKALDLEVEIISPVLEQLNVQHAEAVKYILG